jgi:hypothetical protein
LENTGVNFFVVRIAFGEGNRDRAEVFRNPTSLVDEGACKPDAQLEGNFAFDRISLGNFHGTKVHEVDEIRVGTTFRAVTGRRNRGPDRLVPRVAGMRNSAVFVGWVEPSRPTVKESSLVVAPRELKQFDARHLKITFDG